MRAGAGRRMQTIRMPKAPTMKFSFQGITPEQLGALHKILLRLVKPGKDGFVETFDRKMHAEIWAILGLPSAQWVQLEEYRERFGPVYLKRLAELNAAAPARGEDLEEDSEDAEEFDEAEDARRAEAVGALAARGVSPFSNP